MDTQDTIDMITTFEDFSAAVAHENMLLTEDVIKAESTVRHLTAIIDKQTAELEERKNRIALLESALTFAEDKNAEHVRALGRIDHFVRVERVCLGAMPPVDMKGSEVANQNVAMKALLHAGEAE